MAKVVSVKFYKVTYWSETDSSEGFGYFTSRADAEAAKRAYDDATAARTATIEEIGVVPTKAGILRALRLHGSHNDNG